MKFSASKITLSAGREGSRKVLKNIATRLIVICGPTAGGKTAAAIEVAEQVDGEIINADSVQVYRLMDIGAAKPTAAERARVRHHLIDVVDPDEPFDAASFARLGRATVADIASRGKVPIVAGGTGLYIKALLGGLARRAASDPGIRRRLQEDLREEGPAALHARLAQIDPATAARVHPNDAVRIVRALEVYAATGRPLSAHHRGHRFSDAPFEAFTIGLDMPRETLYARIDRRVEAMMARGLETEVRRLLARGYGEDLKPMQSLGYRHMTALIAGRVDRAEAVRTLQRDTRRFAKRQLTWFRANPRIRWVSPADIASLLPEIGAFLQGDGR
jgi:tRNA dimethylallyltransferase